MSPPLSTLKVVTVALVFAMHGQTHVRLKINPCRRNMMTRCPIEKMEALLKEATLLGKA